MKKNLLLLLIGLIPCGIFAQSLSPEVISSAGDYFESANGSLSWTLGELATETFSNGNYILTQGFQQPITVRITLDMQVYLEGPFNGAGMNAILNTEGVIPLNHPYNTPPWNYTGSESVSSIPTGAVDWVLIELRDATSPASAISSTRIARQAGLLMNDGSVIGVNGLSDLSFETHYLNNLYIVVWHRNHLGIMSANSPNYSGGIYSYDFTLGSGQVYGGTNGYKAISGFWVMVSGDANQDGLVNGQDEILWSLDAGQHGYPFADFNLDAEVENTDKNDRWYPNQSYFRTIP